jgi:hypothetical protein
MSDRNNTRNERETEDLDADMAPREYDAESLAFAMLTYDAPDFAAYLDTADGRQLKPWSLRAIARLRHGLGKPMSVARYENLHAILRTSDVDDGTRTTAAGHV